MTPLQRNSQRPRGLAIDGPCRSIQTKGIWIARRNETSNVRAMADVGWTREGTVIAQTMQKPASGARIVDSNGIIEPLRAVRSPAEPEYMRAAYSVGVGFPPMWSENHVRSTRPNDPRVLKPGMCFHLVPALYKADLGCVCCNSTICITETGVEPLTDIPAELMIVD